MLSLIHMCPWARHKTTSCSCCWKELWIKGSYINGHLLESTCVGHHLELPLSHYRSCGGETFSWAKLISYRRWRCDVRCEVMQDKSVEVTTMRKKQTLGNLCVHHGCSANLIVISIISRHFILIGTTPTPGLEETSSWTRILVSSRLPRPVGERKATNTEQVSRAGNWLTPPAADTCKGALIRRRWQQWCKHCDVWIKSNYI